MSIEDPANSALLTDRGAPIANDADTDGRRKLRIGALSLPLPSGAATEATLSKLTQTQGSTTSGQSGPLLFGATSLMRPSYTAGTTNPLSLNIYGQLRTESSMADGAKDSYSASVSALAVAVNPTDIFTIIGSATKVIRITSVHLTATRTTSGTTTIQLIKRSQPNSGGTSSATTTVPYDSTSPSATAVVLSYTANPTLGTAVGAVDSIKKHISSTNNPLDETIWEFGSRPTKAIILRGVSESLSINLGGSAIAGGNFDMTIEWTEN